MPQSFNKLLLLLLGLTITPLVAYLFLNFIIFGEWTNPFVLFNSYDEFVVLVPSNKVTATPSLNDLAKAFRAKEIKQIPNKSQAVLLRSVVFLNGRQITGKEVRNHASDVVSYLEVKIKSGPFKDQVGWIEPSFFRKLKPPL